MVLPFLALLAAVPVAWGGWLTWTDVVIFVVCYVVTGLGITVGFHRYLTHGSFKAKRWLRVTLAVAGAIAIEGSPTQWVADHRRHHAVSRPGGRPALAVALRRRRFWGLTKGLFYAHVGWLFHRELSNRERFAPDLLADKDIQPGRPAVPAVVTISALAPGRRSAAWSPGRGRAR